MPQVDPIILQLRADVASYNSKVSQAQKLTDQKLGAIEAKGSAMEQSISKSFNQAAKSALSFAAGFVTVQLAREFLDIADKAKNMAATLRLATAATGSYAVAQQDVARIAEQTRSGINETATLYAAFARSSKDLGISQEQVAAITQTVAESFIVSGTSAANAADGTRQLVQAFQSGVLRGDEFNSIMENAPRLARLLAESLGVTTGELRAMAEAGQLSADKLARAFSDKKFTAGLQAEFDQMPVTFDQAMTLVANSAQITFSAFDRGGAFSQAIATFVADGSTGFGDLASAAESMGVRVRSELAGIAAAVDPVISAVHDLIGALGGLSDAKSAGSGFFSQDAKDIDKLTGFVARQGMLGAVLTGNDPFSDPASRKGTNVSGRYEAARNKAAGERRLALVMGTDIYAGNEQYRPKQVVGPARPVPVKAKKAKKGPKSPLDPGAFESEEAQLNIEILRDKARQADAIVRTADTAIAAAGFEIEMLNAQQARERGNTERNKKYTAEEKAKLIALQSTTYALDRAAVIAQRDLEVAERNSRAQRENDNLEIAAFDAQKHLAKSRQEQLAIENSILDILDKQEAAELETLIAQGKVLDATKARGDLAAQQAARRAGEGRDAASPLEKYKDRLDKNPDQIHDQIEGYVVDELQAVQDSIASGISKIIGTKDPLITGLINLFIEQVIMRPIANAFASASGGGGGISGLFGSIASGIGSIFGGGNGGFGGGTPSGAKGSDGAGGGVFSNFGGARASGGYVAPGQSYRVNEGASPGRVEAFMSRDGGKIIPLGQMNALQRGGQQAGGEIMVRVSLTDDLNARIDNRAAGVSVQVVRAAAPALIDASAKETLSRAGRPRV